MNQEEYFGREISTNIPHGESVFWVLWDNVAEIYKETTKTTFISEISRGQLDPIVFSGFIISDCYYCFNGPHGYDTCITKMPKGIHRSFFQYKRNSFIPYNKKYPEKLNVTNEVNTIPSPASYAQAEFEKLIALHFEPIYFLIAKLPCEYFWPKLFSDLSCNFDGNIYRNWMLENSDLSLPYEIGNYLDLADKENRIDMSIANSVYIWGSYFELLNFASATSDPTPSLCSLTPLEDLSKDINTLALNCLGMSPPLAATR
ncbi:hypothetical protein [uncultured Ruegeria sp.]|uniref:hypothetical protein n=1 Tax=uncultured Ruegeria sp. TaxID=259304 RepID=UPI002603AAB5|nr:hypothetical protein [uncultured Ruegeria sp.]